jgi:L-asparaginase
MIGIELEEDGQGRVVADFNCGGMFRAWIDETGEERARVFRGEY